MHPFKKFAINLILALLFVSVLILVWLGIQIYHYKVYPSEFLIAFLGVVIFCYSIASSAFAVERAELESRIATDRIISLENKVSRIELLGENNIISGYTSAQIRGFEENVKSIKFKEKGLEYFQFIFAIGVFILALVPAFEKLEFDPKKEIEELQRSVTALENAE